MTKLAPSILTADFSNLAAEIALLDQHHIEYLHLDVMDGKFVPNITFGPLLIRSLRPLTSMKFDVHLMIDEPEKYINQFVQAGADILTFHIEATKHPHRIIQSIKDFGILAGISLNPSTSLNTLEYLLPDLDLILLMTVNPGFGGQSFIPQMKDKIVKLRGMIDIAKPEIILQVDGGVKTNNAAEIADLGVDLIVSGSDVFNEKKTEQLKKYDIILNIRK